MLRFTCSFFSLVIFILNLFSEGEVTWDIEFLVTDFTDFLSSYIFLQNILWFLFSSDKIYHCYRLLFPFTSCCHHTK